MSIKRKIRNLKDTITQYIVDMLTRKRRAAKEGGTHLRYITAPCCGNCKYYEWDGDIHRPWCAHDDRTGPDEDMEPDPDMICDLYEPREQGGK